MRSLYTESHRCTGALVIRLACFALLLVTACEVEIHVEDVGPDASVPLNQGSEVDAGEDAEYVPKPPKYKRYPDPFDTEYASLH